MYQKFGKSNIIPLTLFYVFIFPDLNSQGSDPEPEFQGSIQNVTYPAGREAVLTCTVKNLGKYKVSSHSS